MTQYSAEAKGFHGVIKAVVDINKNNGEINQIWAENVTPNTVGAAGIDNWLKEANNQKSVEVDAISGASISTGALRKAAIEAVQKSGAIAIKNSMDTVSGASQADSHTKEKDSGVRKPANYPLIKEKMFDYDG